MSHSCYRCDRYFPTNSKFDDKDNWICQDCAKDIMIVSGWPLNETEEQIQARYRRKEYWEEKKCMNGDWKHD